jgi:hypothetical protein
MNPPHAPLPTPLPVPNAAVAPAPPVIVAEADPTTALWLRDALSARFSCVVVRTGGAALRAVDPHPRAIVVIGRQLADMTPDALVSALGAPERRDRVALLAAEGVAPTCDRIFYRVRPGLSASDLAGIVDAAARTKAGGVVVPISGTRAWSNRLVFDICAAVSARPDPSAAATAVEEGMARLMPLSRATCAFYDADTGLVWTESSTAPIETVATTGIIGFVDRRRRPALRSQRRQPRRVGPRVDPRRACVRPERRGARGSVGDPRADAGPVRRACVRRARARGRAGARGARTAQR